MIPNVQASAAGCCGTAATVRLPAGVYLLTPDWHDSGRLLEATAAALAGGVRWLQYRNKQADAALRLAQARALRELTAAHDAGLVVNDDVRLALEVGADAVHVGRDDADPRGLIGARPLAIGVSCYDRFELAQAAWQAGAHYVAFGAVFASPTKPHAVRAPLELIDHARAKGMHVAAIGGIDASNIRTVAAHGAHAAALITAVYGAPDPEAAARGLVEQFELGRNEHDSQ